MITRRHILRGSAATLLAPLVLTSAGAQEPARATVLFDAFGEPSNLKRVGVIQSSLSTAAGVSCSTPEERARGSPTTFLR
jgi:hypothetical protein